jgi:multicomponent Na+:H+ antiporter subunit D
MTGVTGAAALAPLAITVPVVAACALLAGGSRLPRRVVDAAATLAAAAVAGLDVALLAAAEQGPVVTWTGGWSPTVGVTLVADPFGAGVALTAALLLVCALVFSWRYFDTAEAHFPALMLLFLAGMTGFALSGDLFDMLVFFELMGAVAYALTGFHTEDPLSVQGALSFGVVNSLGAYVTLFGIGLIYSRTGQLGLAPLSAALAARPVDPLVTVAFTLVATGFLVKAAMVPFHFWLDDAHAVAPTPVCVMFSGIMVELGVYGVFRVYIVAFGVAVPPETVHRAFLVLGTLTGVVGAVMCLAQRHLKRLLAYSTIAHTGLFLLSLGTLDAAGTAGGALYVAGHAAVKSALFLMAGVILNRYGSVDEIELHGRGRRATLLPWLMPLGALALAGLPPFGTGLGKAVAEEAVAAAGAPWAVTLFVGVSAATGGAVLRAALRIYWGVGPLPDHHPAEDDETSGEEEHAEVGSPLQRVPPTMLVPIGVLLLGGLALGLVPAFADGVAEAAARFVDRGGYVAAALGTGTGSAPVAVPVTEWTATGVGLGLLSATLAVVVALLAVHGRGQPRLITTARALQPALTGLRRLHSGHIGDYVTWLLVGVAALGALLVLPLS